MCVVRLFMDQMVLAPWLGLTVPKQLFSQLNPCLEASFLQEVVRNLEKAKYFSALLLHQQRFRLPMHIAQQQARNSSLQKKYNYRCNIKSSHLIIDMSNVHPYMLKIWSGTSNVKVVPNNHLNASYTCKPFEKKQKWEAQKRARRPFTSKMSNE